MNTDSSILISKSNPEIETFEYQSVRGKTYSLFGDSSDTKAYYIKVSEISDTFLSFFNSHAELLSFLQKLRKKNNSYHKLMIENEILHSSIKELSVFTYNIQELLNGLPRCHFLNSPFRTKEFQYYLAMIEIELLNRMNKDRFFETNYKIAFLPHCLKDFIDGCKSTKSEFVYICKNCSKNCFLNRINRLLKKNGVNSIIWMTANLKNMLKKLLSKYGSIGVLGIACIPQLIYGMESVNKRNIPVVGVPLNANRCIKWMGDFYENSIDLDYLNSLIM